MDAHGNADGGNPRQAAWRGGYRSPDRIVVVPLRLILARILWGIVDTLDSLWADLHPERNAFWDDVKPEWRTLNWDVHPYAER